MGLRKRKRIISMLLVIAMLMNISIFSVLAKEEKFAGVNVAVETVSTGDGNSSEEAAELLQGDESNTTDSSDDISEAEDADTDSTGDENADDEISDEDAGKADSEDGSKSEDADSDSTGDEDADGKINDEKADNAGSEDDSKTEDAASDSTGEEKADGEISDEDADDKQVSSYTISITLPEEGVNTAEDSGELTQTVSAGSAMEDIFLVSTYEDEPFNESYADDFNTYLFEDTGLTASCDEDSVITIGGIPTADVIVDLTDAFADDKPVTIADGSAVYVSSDGNDTSGDGSEDKPYATISKAYTAVPDNGTIYLLSDVDVSAQITFGTAKTVTITSADSSNVKTMYSKIQFGYDNKNMMTVTEGEVIFKNITLDGTGQRQAAKTGFPNGVANSPGCIYVTKSGAIATLDAGTTIQNFWKNNGTSGGSSVLKANVKNAQINIRDGVLITNCVLEAGNTDDPSSVVSSGTGGIVYMSGGTVTGNTLSTTQSASTAVVNIGMISNPHFWMTGGTISGNTINNGAAAVYMRGEANACDMQFGDTAYVYDNYVSGTSGDQRNVYLKNNNSGTENSKVYVKLCSALDDSAKLGVYAEMIGVATKVAQGGGVSGVGTGSYIATAEDATHFVSDKETGAEILYCGGSEETCGLLQHRTGTTHEKAIYLSSSPAVTATKNENDSNKVDISIDRCTSDETYVVLDKDMKPVTGKTISGGSYVSSGNGTFTLDSTSTTTIDMKELDKDSGPYTVMLVSGTLSVGSDGKADTSSLTDIATVNIVNFAGDGVTWSDDTNSFENGDYDIVTVPHNDQTGKADKTYTATAKTNYTFVETDAISGKLDNSEETALSVDATKDEDAEKYSVSVTVPAYGTTSSGTIDYNTVTLTGNTEEGEAGNISISDVTVSADSVGTLDESLTVTMNITDSNNYAVGTTPTYKYTVTNGRTASGAVTATTGEDGTTTYTISGLKYGDHVKVYADGEDVPSAYFKVLNTSLENGSFENVTLSTESKYTGSSDLKTGTTIAAWHTTASDQNMEVYQSLNAYGVSASPDAGNVAELNAVEASSLYQEISTTPGSTLSWTLYHMARSNAGEATQQMAIVIGPALDAEDDDPYKKSDKNTSDMFMEIAAQITSPVAGETYYTEYNGKTYQVTIASDTKTGGSWKNYMGAYTVPDDQEETVFAFASLGTSSAVGNLIDGVGFGSGVAITEVKAAKNSSDAGKIDISIENSTKNGVYVVLDKDMKPVTGKTLTNGSYVTGGNGTFTLTDSTSTTTIGMEGVEKDNGPYTVMRVLSGSLSVDSTTGKAVTSNLTDIATVNIVNFTGDGVKWSDGTNSFESGDFDIVTVPHDDQTGKATKKYTATTKTGYVFAEADAITGKLDNSEATAATVTATKDESAEEYSVSVTVPDYGTTSKGTTNYNTVTLTGNTEISIDVKLLDETDGEEMTAGKTTYDGTPVAHSDGEVYGATLSYTWQKKNSDDDSYTDIDDNTAPSDAGEYNLKVTATKTGSTEVVTKDLTFTISPKTLTVNATASNKVYNGTTEATITKVTMTGAVGDDEVALNMNGMSAAFEDANAGTGKTVTVSGLTLDNNDKGNYKLPDTITTTANITKASHSDEAVSTEGSRGETNTFSISSDYVVTSGTVSSSITVSDTNEIIDGTPTYDSSTGTLSYKLKSSATDGQTATVTLTVTSANYNDYNIVVTVGVTPKETVEINITGEDYVYDGTAHAPTGISVTDGKLSVSDLEVSYKGTDGTTYPESKTAPTNAGKYIMTVKVPDSNLKYTGSKTCDFEIKPKALTVKVTAADKEYDGKADATLSTATLVGVETADTGNVTIVTGGVSAAFDNKDAGTEKSVTLTGEYTLTGDAAKNYTVTQPTELKAKITAKTLTVTATASDKVYNGTTEATVTDVTISGAVGEDEVAINKSDMSAAFEDANAGTGKTVTVSGLTLDNNDKGNYKLPDTITTTADITKANGKGTVTMEGWTYGERAKTPTATSTTNPETEFNKISYQYKLKDAEDGTYTDTVPTDAGEYTVKAIFPANGNYNAATATANFTIKPKELTVNVTPEDKVYDGTTTATLSTATLDGVETADTSKVTLVTDGVSAAFDNANAGTDKSVTLTGEYTLTGDAAKNYTVTQPTGLKADITQAPLTITGATVTSKTYDGNDSATITAVSFSGLKNGETLTADVDYTVSDAKYDGVNATGSDAATKVEFMVMLNTSGTAANYSLNLTEGSQSATIGKASYSYSDSTLDTKGSRGETNTFGDANAYVVTGGTVSSSITVNDTNGIFEETPTYDNSTGKLTYKLKSSATDGQKATVTLPVTSANYNDYNIVVTVGVTPKETVAIGITGGTYEYDGTAHAPTDISVTEGKVSKSALEVTYKGADGTTYPESTTAPTNAGKYIMTVKVPDSNLKYTGSAACAFEIKPKALTATITADNKTYDGNTTATVTPTLEGVVGSDSGKVTAVVTNPVFADKNAGDNKKVTASITLEGTASANYTVNATAETTANITAKEVTISGVTVESSKIYDKTTSAAITNNGTISGKIDTDDLSFIVGTASYEDAKAGTDKKVTFTGFALTGTDAGNYKLKEQPASVKADITAKEVTISDVIIDTTKVYDGNADANITNSGELIGIMTGDTVTIKTGKATYNNKNVGENKTVTFSNFGLEGDDANNYKLTEQPEDTAAAITQREVTISGLTATKTYDGDNTADKSEISGTPVIGNKAVDSDDVTLNTESMTGEFNSANVDEATEVTIKGLSLTGTDASNYKLPATVTCTGEITKASGSGTVAMGGWTYGETANTPTATSETNPGSESNPVTYQYKLKDADDGTYTDTKPTDAGEYTVKAIFPANGNYIAATATYDFTISRKALTVDVKAEDKVYDKTTTATLGTAILVGVETADTDKVTLVISGVSAAFDNADAGTEKSVTLSGEYTLTGDAAKNYTVTQPTGLKADITAKEVTIIGVTVESSKIYDKTTSAAITNNGTISGKIDTDDLSITVGTASYDDAKVGTDKTVTFTGFELTGTDVSNYKLKEQPASVRASITAKEVTISGVTIDKNKVYDGKTTAKITSSGELIGVMTGDNVTIKTGTASYDDAKVGTDKNVTFTGFALTGTDAGNYKLKEQPASVKANIARKTATGSSGGNSSFHGDTTSAVTTKPDSVGVAGTDNNAALDTTDVTASLNTNEVGENKPDTLDANLALTGDAVNDYALTQPTDTTEKLQSTNDTMTAPKTGDESNIIHWIVLALLSGTGAIVTIVLGKRKK